jgi:preprotein translocase subunit SecA
VIDKQRTRIYAKRDQISKTVSEEEKTEGVIELTVIDEIQEFVHEVVENVVHAYTSTNVWMYAEMAEELSQIVGATVLESELRAYTRPLALQEYLIEMVQGLLKSRLASADETITLDICKRIYLSVMDRNWVQHIDEMHYLREKVSLYGYAQIDPLVMYKKEAFDKFQRLLFTIKKETLAQVIRFDFAGQQTANELAAQIATETNGQLDMMEVLKQVTA